MELRPVHRRHRDRSGDSGELWSHVGVNLESMSPKARAIAGVMTGGAILLAAAFLILFTDLWWLVLIFCWIVFLAPGTFARGVPGLMESRQGERPPKHDKERELLEALRTRGELMPAQAAVETSLTVSEAEEMLKVPTFSQLLEVRARGGGLSYSLWGYERVGKRAIGGSQADRTL